MSLPAAEVLRAELNTTGMTYEQVGRKYGVTKQAVSMALRRANLSDPTRHSQPWTDYRAYIPWRIPNELSNHTLIRLLRLYARRQERLPLDAAETERLNRWLQYMDREKLVVAYGPRDGFRLVPQRTGDRHYVRRPAK
ncbi:MAG: hypothetical protein M3Q75_00845 [Gemmatimonadota bacterium]|nr:hypothetical protein [Gemmatimonadota bacterium]